MHFSTRSQRLFLSGLALVISSNADAFYLSLDAKDNSRFKAYETNGILFKYNPDDDTSSQIDISMRYLFHNPTVSELRIMGSNYQTYFSYTMRSDFYWFLENTRDSGPMISRYQNPAIHYRRYSIDSDPWYYRAFTWVDFAFEHISNGQSLDAETNQELIRQAYEMGDDGNEIMDSISRVGATIALTLESNNQFQIRGNKSEVFIKAFIRAGQEADVFWGEYESENVDFYDFQILRFQGKIVFDPNQTKEMPRQLNVEMNIGKKLFATESWNFMLIWPITIKGTEIEIPLAFSVHLGPLYTMSDYTRSHRAYSVGFTFAY